MLSPTILTKGEMGKYLSGTNNGDDKFGEYEGWVSVGVGKDKGERGKDNQFNLFKGHRNKNYSRI